MLCFVFAATLLASLCSTVVGFGLTVSGNSYIVDTSGGLIFTVDSTSGDITSMKFNGIEAQDSSKHSQIASGIGADCSWVRGGHDNNYITITCSTSTLIQYYVARYKDPSIHMATYTTAEPSVGELRFIARLSHSTLPNGYSVSDIAGGTAIEGSDVFLVGSQTRSKFYSSRQFIDDQVHGVSGSNIAAWMIIPGTGYEGSSGGPFMRDINNQGGSQQELYFYMVRISDRLSMHLRHTFRTPSTHKQNVAYRMGLHGPYALWFTTGSTPSSDIDTSFWDGLDVTGWVSEGDRGRVKGSATGYPSAYANYMSVGFSNSNAQYWVRTDSSGAFVSPYMKPGTYTMTLYKMELEVATQSVTVTAGSVGTSNIASTEATPSVIWQIGEIDGTPRGFLNADLIETMHPSDSRMADWGPVTFTIGNNVNTFPMAIFKDIGAVTVKFTRCRVLLGGARTLQIATTLAFAGKFQPIGVSVHDMTFWTSSTPSIPDQPDSRGVTRGTWRGNNIMYTYSIPSGVLNTGSTVNTLTISVASGSSGSDFLSPNVVFDGLRLY
ncbi:polysaccharide lyase family 4 protein [Desarmillaria tabescens]|uniref:rhamnogalacturonan endolyase n=1 Tax=Armillaria tabescens TaxID=1929756 RepID=A0AA39JAE5_ARMTA|nr:polysaccharide lyase family 4 protein [Desarmillaria tabescens]KAK0438360.1 polysaccharide lyase family 4 protein [Desarmillaria tabescens]